MITIRDPRRVSAKRIRSHAVIVCTCGCLSLTIQLHRRRTERETETARGRERERDRTTEREKERWGSAGERDIERERDIRIYVWNTCAHTFMHTFAAPWCTVEREYKRLKAKRKQTGSSLSKPNSGWGRGVKLRHAAVGSPSERASERGNFLSFVSHYISALLF